MATYYDLIVSGKGDSRTISGGDLAYRTTVTNSARLIVNSGGYVESTVVRGNSTYISNGGVAVSTVLSGGTMTLLEGGVASCVDVRSNARLNVRSGCVATGVVVSSGGNVYAVVYGNDGVTRIEGTNELGSFSLSNGVASNFVINAGLVYTVSSGGTAVGTVIRKNGSMTIASGGTATGIIQERDAKIFARVYGGDSQTCVAGSNECGEFLLSGGVASGFVLNENVAQYVYSGGTALHTVISSSWGHQSVSSGGTVSATSVCNGGSMTIYDSGVASDAWVYSGGSMMVEGGEVNGATVFGELLVTTGTYGEGESGGTATLKNITIMSGGKMDVSAKADFGDTVTLNGTITLADSMTILDDASLVFDVTGRNSSSGAILNDWTKVVAAAGATYSVSVSVGESPVCGFYKLADKVETFDKTITVNSGTTQLGTLNVGEQFEDGLRYSLSIDGASALLLTIADTVAPVLDGDPEAAVLGYSATITWNPAIDTSGIKNYILSVDGNDFEVEETSYTLSDLKIRSYDYQLKAVDIFGNESGWSAPQSFDIVDITPQNVVLNSSGATWDASPNVTGYVAELSVDGFANMIKFAVSQPGIDFYNPAVGDYGFKVRADIDTVFSDVTKTTVDTAATGAVKFVSDNDGIADAFFAQSDEVWLSGYYARNTVTGEQVSLQGKNRIANVFRGSDDASVLFLSDSGDGDALELDDIFTALPDDESEPIARFSQIGEVRAGAGDDVVDLTSTKFSADGMTLRGGDGDDVIWSGDGENLIFGDAGNDRMNGGAGNDVLCGGIGDDRMTGGGGDDIFTFAGNWGKDTVKQTADGGVTLWFGDLTAEDVTVSYLAGNTVITHGADTVTVVGRNAEEVDLRFGAAGYEEQFAELAAQGAFADYSSAKIFEDKDSKAVIVSLT